MDNTRTVRGMIEAIVIEQTRYLRHYIGQVCDVNDDTNKGRVKVTVPYLGWISPAQGAWCFPRDKHGMVVPKVGEWVEVYFIGGHKDHPVYLGIANEIKDQVTKSYNANTLAVIFEYDDCKITFDEAAKKLAIVNGTMEVDIDNTAASMTINKDATTQIILDSTGITLKTVDDVTWQPNILSVDPITGFPHGGAVAGITRLKGSA